MVPITEATLGFGNGLRAQGMNRKTNGYGSSIVTMVIVVILVIVITSRIIISIFSISIIIIEAYITATSIPHSLLTTSKVGSGHDVERVGIRHVAGDPDLNITYKAGELRMWNGA